MDMQLAGAHFSGVQIPLLWGKFAVLAHGDGRLSVVDLSRDQARVLILADHPAPGVEYSEQEDGCVIYGDAGPVFFFSGQRKLLRDVTGELPECRIAADHIRIGASTVKLGMIRGFPVGIAIGEGSLVVGAQMPAGLAPLVL